MSTNKIMALIGNILLTLNNFLGLLCIGFGFAVFANLATLNTNSFLSNGDQLIMSHGNIIFYSAADDITSRFSLNDYVPAILTILAVVVIIVVIINIFTWIAFAKMEGPHGRGWKIFLLVMGILNIGSFFAGIFFILAFALNSTKKPIENTTIN